MVGRFLFVGWDGGGNLQPLLGLERLLAARGHEILTLAWGTSAERVEPAGSQYVEIEQPPFDLKARTWEEQSDESLFVGADIAEMVLAHGTAWRADVLVVDGLLRSALCGAEASGIPTVALVHVQRPFFDYPPSADPETWGWDFEAVNESRKQLSLEPLPAEDTRAVVQLHARCARALTVMPREFERPDQTVPSNVVHVGPIFEETAAAWPDKLPWRPDDVEPLAVVSMSTTYMRHEQTLVAILRALEPMSMRVLVTLGNSLGALEAHEVPEGRWEMVRYVPHLGVLPHASLVVTHAGMGTVMASFTSGVPMVCLPFGRDQHMNAERVEALGVGRVLDADASAETIAGAITEVTTQPAYRRRAARMAEMCAAYGRGARAIRELEGLISSKTREGGAADRDQIS